ncbi:Aste57867_11840 [Aphanomyces stellatus]|uniref:Aste57867_11840 protein n=1 Tax=Aphanomyces stellatus TaxID=120398 RepID=A0A485KU46_9STRA|nr:hypothetical protein As57867_011795 [Aphanomyces stellatus]VFT88695.1 Aste57867_11840 [Aphanomyces stellatus]
MRAATVALAILLIVHSGTPVHAQKEVSPTSDDFYPCQNLVEGDHIKLLASGLDDGWGLASNGDFKPAVVGIPETWKIIKKSSMKEFIMLQATSTAKYLGRCHQCAPDVLAMTPDQAYVRFLDWRGQPWTQWRCENIGHGKIRLMSDASTPQYLAWCVGCLTTDTAYSPASVFVYPSRLDGEPVNEWTVVRVATPSNHNEVACDGDGCGDAIWDVVD